MSDARMSMKRACSAARQPRRRDSEDADSHSRPILPSMRQMVAMSAENTAAQTARHSGEASAEEQEQELEDQEEEEADDREEEDDADPFQRFGTGFGIMRRMNRVSFMPSGSDSEEEEIIPDVADDRDNLPVMPQEATNYDPREWGFGVDNDDDIDDEDMHESHESDQQEAGSEQDDHAQAQIELLARHHPNLLVRSLPHYLRATDDMYTLGSSGSVGRGSGGGGRGGVGGGSMVTTRRAVTFAPAAGDQQQEIDLTVLSSDSEDDEVVLRSAGGGGGRALVNVNGGGDDDDDDDDVEIVGTTTPTPPPRARRAPPPPSGSEPNRKRRRAGDAAGDTSAPSLDTQRAESTNISMENNEVIENFKNSLKCSVCLDVIDEMTSTICGHVYCGKCIRLAIRVTQKCPLCQRPLRPTDIHGLYF